MPEYVIAIVYGNKLLKYYSKSKCVYGIPRAISNFFNFLLIKNVNVYNFYVFLQKLVVI